MLVKILGAGIIVVASMVYAERMLSDEKKKIDDLDAFIDIISYIKNQIDLYSMPLEKIFNEMDADKLERVGLAYPPQRFSDIINSDGLNLDDSTRKVLSDFSSSLGKSYREMQIKICDQTISELLSKKKSISEAFPSRKKTVLALCLGVAGVLVIALI